MLRSRASKVLFGCTVATAGIIWYVQQTEDMTRKVSHVGGVVVLL